MPGGLGFRCADAGQQILLPQEPLAVGAALAHLNGTGIVRAAAGNEQLHVVLLLAGYVIALNDDCIGLRGSVVIVGRCAYEVGEREIGLAVAEAVVEEGYLLTVERTGTSEPVEHLKADILIRRIGAEGKDGQSRRLKRCVKARLGERLHFGKALGQRSEGELLSLVAYRLYGGSRRLLRRALKLIKYTHIISPFSNAIASFS